jgi:hypothetical protein
MGALQLDATSRHEIMGAHFVSNSYDIRHLFGFAETTPDLIRAKCFWQPAMLATTMELMGGELEVHGSVVTLDESNKAGKSRFLNEVIGPMHELRGDFVRPDYRRDFWWGYYNNEYDFANGNDSKYFVARMLLAMSGPNEDYQNKNPIKNPNEIVKSMTKLLRMQMSYPIDGASRVMAVIQRGEMKFLQIHNVGEGATVNVLVT